MLPMLHEQLIPDTYSSQYSSKRDTPELDLEAKASVSHRKRVPVAVSFVVSQEFDQDS